MQEASRNTDLMEQARQMLEEAELRGRHSAEVLGK